MPRVTCRCGERLTVRVDGPERIDCPRCGAHIRVRQPGIPPAQSAGPNPSNDGFIRFHCPCGRRLKVREEDGLDAGRCPDCGRVVPVPSTAMAPSSQPPSAPSSARPIRVTQDSRTEELDTDDLARLERWSSKFKPVSGGANEPPDQPWSPRQPSGSPQPQPPGMPAGAPKPSIVKFEAGMRVCPRCGRPVHLNANACRECGAAVPRR